MVRWLCFASCSAFDFRLSLPLYAWPRGKCIFNILRVYIMTSMDLRAFAFAFEPRLRNRLLPLPLLLETIERSALAFALSFSAGHVGAGRAGGGALQDGIGRDAVVGAGLPGERREMGLWPQAPQTAAFSTSEKRGKVCSAIRVW